jgi:hypothetical protein
VLIMMVLPIVRDFASGFAPLSRNLFFLFDTSTGVCAESGRDGDSEGLAFPSSP